MHLNADTIDRHTALLQHRDESQHVYLPRWCDHFLVVVIRMQVHLGRGRVGERECAFDGAAADETRPTDSRRAGHRCRARSRVGLIVCERFVDAVPHRHRAVIATHDARGVVVHEIDRVRANHTVASMVPKEYTPRGCDCSCVSTYVIFVSFAGTTMSKSGPGSSCRRRRPSRPIAAPWT
jgi:hypothetical protein